MLTSQLGQISALVGFLLPLVAAFVMKEDWPNWLKSSVGIAVCIVAGIVTTLAENKFNTKDVLGSVITIFTLTKITYLSVYKPAGLAQPKIKASTS